MELRLDQTRHLLISNSCIILRTLSVYSPHPLPRNFSTNDRQVSYFLTSHHMNKNPFWYFMCYRLQSSVAVGRFLNCSIYSTCQTTVALEVEGTNLCHREWILWRAL